MKTAKQITGNKGERTAMEWLETKGYRTLHQNWSKGKGDLDLVMVYQQELVFVEVKTRFGMHPPEEAMPSKRQIQHLLDLAERFLEAHPGWPSCRFDLVVVLYFNSGTECFHYPGIFP